MMRPLILFYGRSIVATLAAILYALTFSSVTLLVGTLSYLFAGLAWGIVTSVGLLVIAVVCHGPYSRRVRELLRVERRESQP